MPPYNLSLIQNTTNYAAYPQAVDSWTGGQFGIWIVLATFLIALFVLRTEGIKRAMIAASATSSFLGIILFFLGMFPAQYINITSAVFFGSLVLFIFTKD